jgi:hypothetical protein
LLGKARTAASGVALATGNLMLQPATSRALFSRRLPECRLPPRARTAANGEGGIRPAGERVRRAPTAPGELLPANLIHTAVCWLIPS